MRYIKTYEKYKFGASDVEVQPIKEEFLGKLFNKVKSKISLELSKKIGSAKEIEKIISKYKEELSKIGQDKNSKIKAIGELVKAEKEGADIDKTQLNKAQSALEKSEKTYEKLKDNLKKKFDIFFNKIIKEEKNPNIKEYINLRKLDMISELLEQEIEDFNQEMGITEEDIKSSNILKELVNRKKEEFDTIQELKTKTESKISVNDESKFKSGDKIVYVMKDGGENSAVISNNQSDLKDGQIRVETENSPNGFPILKSKIKSTDVNSEEDNEI